MKRFKTLSIFFIFVVGLLVASALTAKDSADTYGSCGAQPGVLEKLFTNAQKIREKCVEDIYEENKEKTRKEVEELHNTSNKLGAELKKVAVKVDFNIVHCAPRRGDPAREPKLIKRCEDLVKAQNAIISRIDELMGWNDRPVTKVTHQSSESEANPPCPSKDKLKDMQVARAFNKKLYVLWERCKMNEFLGE